MRKLLTVILLIVSSASLFAQDQHYSQFYAAPWTLNPAMTGAFSGNYRISGLMRGQWGQVLKNEAVPMYRTYTACADFRTNKGFSGNDAFGAGVFFLGDQAGESKFGTMGAGLSLAYHKALDKWGKHHISLGIQAEVYQRKIDYTSLQWGSQWDGVAYNSLLPTNESFVNNNFLFYTVSTGLLYYGRIGQRTTLYAGFSAYHLNRPNISFLGDPSARINMKFMAHGGIRFPVIGRFDLMPKFIVMDQGQSIEFNWGADARILFDPRDFDGSAFKVGFLYRLVGGDKKIFHNSSLNSEAVIITAGVEFNGLNLGIAYDVNVSDLISASQSKGAFEFALSYTGKVNVRKSDKTFCPKF